MIKDVFKLKKNAWHAKLMKFTWNLSYNDFSHMCPYFWLSAFNLVIFPFVLIIKGLCYRVIILSIKDALDSMSTYFEERAIKAQKEWEEELLAKIKSTPSIWEELYKIDLDEKKNRKFRKFINGAYYKSVDSETYWATIDKFNDAKDRIAKLRQERANAESLKALEKMKLKAKRDAKLVDQAVRNKQRINAILKYAKPIVKGLMYFVGGLIVLAAVFGLYKLVIVLANLPHKTWINFRNAALLIGAIIVGAVILYFIVRAIIDWVVNLKFVQNYSNKPRKPSVILKVFKIILYPFRIFLIFAWLADKIGDGIVFMLQMVRDNCPAIKWED